MLYYSLERRGHLIWNSVRREGELQPQLITSGIVGPRAILEEITGTNRVGKSVKRNAIAVLDQHWTVMKEILEHGSADLPEVALGTSQRLTYNSDGEVHIRLDLDTTQTMPEGYFERQLAEAYANADVIPLVAPRSAIGQMLIYIAHFDGQGLEPLYPRNQVSRGPIWRPH